MLTKEEAIEVLKTVVDPEIQLDVWTLGLIYEIKVKDNNSLYVRMTFTSPACPYAPQLAEEIKQKLEEKGFIPELDFTFDPPWAPSDEVRMMLGSS